jgi:hypothetical protein
MGRAFESVKKENLNVESSAVFYTYCDIAIVVKKKVGPHPETNSKLRTGRAKRKGC